MNNNFPDPSKVNTLDFYSSSFRIMRLLRRRGLQNVEPMGGDIYGLMPNKLFMEWSSYQKRKELIKNKNGGKEFERFVSQIIVKHYCNPSTFSNKVLDLSPGGDYDVLVEGPSEALFYFETKTSIEKTIKSVRIPDLWNFMIRESRLGADMSVFLYDSNQNIEELLIQCFEILYSLSEYLRNKVEKPSEIDIKPWIDKINKANYKKIHKVIKKDLYFLYWPVVVIPGGDKILRNIGNTLSLYFGGIKYLSPYQRLSQIPTRENFAFLPNWKDLPKEVKKETIRKSINQYIKKTYSKT